MGSILYNLYEIFFVSFYIRSSSFELANKIFAFLLRYPSKYYKSYVKSTYNLEILDFINAQKLKF